MSSSNVWKVRNTVRNPHGTGQPSGTDLLAAQTKHQAPFSFYMKFDRATFIKNDPGENHQHGIVLYCQDGREPNWNRWHRNRKARLRHGQAWQKGKFGHLKVWSQSLVTLCFWSVLFKSDHLASCVTESTNFAMCFWRSCYKTIVFPVEEPPSDRGRQPPVSYHIEVRTLSC